MTLFDFKIDDEMTSLYFFRDGSGELKKKNYLFITKDKRIKIKGLPIVKSSCSRLSKKVIEILRPQILERNDIKFPEDYIKQIVYDIIKGDITMVANYYKVKAPEMYKNKSSIQAQIAAVYGAGAHWLVRNHKVGEVGKSKKYCSVVEAAELGLEDLDLKTIWDNELCIFIKDWEHPLFTRRMERASDAYQKKRDRELQEFLSSDLFDSEAVGIDISNEEFLDNEIEFQNI
jgi:hypothetical protein